MRAALLAVAAAMAGWPAHAADPCNGVHATEGACTADVGCTWCRSATLPSGCFTIAVAKELRAGAFMCAKRSARPPRRNEILGREHAEKFGIVWRGNLTSSHDHLPELDPFPEEFSWCKKDGRSFCTANKNQHIPQYCGSCWAFGAMSALADRIKIARNAEGIDIFPSVQHILNCGDGGSCMGGFVDGAYQWLYRVSVITGTGVSYESAQPYLACSSDSLEGFCQHVDTSCKPENVARTCGGYAQEAGPCSGLAHFPNLTISDYGSISGRQAMMKEIYHRGPIMCACDGYPVFNYESGIVEDESFAINHVVSVVGWGKDTEKGPFWVARNSWGEYWGEMGFMRVAFGAINLEEMCSWAVPMDFTAPEKRNQVHCWEGGSNCWESASIPAYKVVHI